MRQSRGFQVRREEGRESSRHWQREINVVDYRLKEQSNILENASFSPIMLKCFELFLISVRLINRWDQDVFSLALHGAWKLTQPLHWPDAQKETACNSFEAQNVTSKLLLHYLSIHILCVENLQTDRQKRLKRSNLNFAQDRSVDRSIHPLVIMNVELSWNTYSTADMSDYSIFNHLGVQKVTLK